MTPASLRRLVASGEGPTLVEANREGVPFTFDGWAFERVGNTTRKMSQEGYESLLLERAHARRRWENQPAEGVRISDINGDIGVA